MLTGVFVGKGDPVLAPIAAILTFVTGRMSSEITYRIQRKLFEENKEDFGIKKRPCESGDCPYRFGTCLVDCTYPHGGCVVDYEE
jgi:hypothetical protein